MNDPYQVLGVSRTATDEEIKKDAETLAKFVKNQQQPQPLANTEHGHTNGKDAAYKSLLADLKK